MNFEMQVIKVEQTDENGTILYRVELKNMTEGLNKNTTLAFMFEKPSVQVGDSIILTLAI
jgi:hypothetical protein